MLVLLNNMNFFSLWHSQIQHQFLLLKKDIKEVVVFTQIHFFSGKYEGQRFIW